MPSARPERERNPFDSRPLTPAGEAEVEHIRMLYSYLWNSISTLPEGRYRSLAITALEESGLWAVKAIAPAFRG